jgi:hypothetical protein
MSALKYRNNPAARSRRDMSRTPRRLRPGRLRSRTVAVVSGSLVVGLALVSELVPASAGATIRAQHEARFLASFQAKQVVTWSIGPYDVDVNCYEADHIELHGGETLSFSSRKPTRVLAYSFATDPTFPSWDYSECF